MRSIPYAVVTQLAASLLLVVVPARVATHADETTELDAKAAWATVPAILERIVPPTFPDRRFAITDYGAAAGGNVDCTEAFREAISACHEAGGGRVVVPAGQYRTGPIHLQSNVELHLAEDSELIFSDRFADYLPPVLVRVGGIELFNYSPLIYARDCRNVAVTGPGRLNGNAQAWWEWKRKETKKGFEMGAAGVPVEERVFGTEEAAIRPSFVSFVGCRNVLLEDFTIGSGPNWTIHPIYCQNVTVRRVQVITEGPNNDGIDPDSCRDVLIEHCVFDTGDDCVVLKSGYNQDGWRVGKPTENVIMRDCFSKRGHGGLVIGSEMSGDVRNVFMEDCEFRGTDRAVRIKSRADRGGVVERVFVRNITAENMQREIILLNMDYTADRSELSTANVPVFRHMHFENITGVGAPAAVRIRGLDASPVENLHFTNLTIESTAGVIGRHVRGLRFEEVNIKPVKGPVFDLHEAVNVVIRKSSMPDGVPTFLKLAGSGSEAVRIEACGLPRTGDAVVTDADVAPGAVRISETK